MSESLISDGELRRQLRERGVDVGPITDTTRELYQKKLRGLKAKSRSKPPVRTVASSSKPPPLRTPVSSSRSSSGSKRQRTAPSTSEESSEPTKKRPKGAHTNVIPWESRELIESPSPKIPPANLRRELNASPNPRIAQIALEPKKEVNRSPRENLYPDLSRHSRVSDAHQLPIGPSLNSDSALRQANSSRLHPHMHEAHSPSQSKLQDKTPPASKFRLPSDASFQADANIPASYNSPSPLFSSSSSMSLTSEAGTPESPVASPQRSKEKGLFHVVTNLFESGVSRLLNVSSSFSSPRKKLEDIRKQDQSPAQSPHRVLSPVLEEESLLDKDHSKFTASIGKSSSSSEYDWELQASDVILCKKSDGQLWKLGKGGFGEVFKGIKDGVDEVAVKRIPLEHHHHSIIKQFKQEIDMISKLRHRHIVQFYGACIQPQNCYMVTELMDNDLFSIMRLPREAPKFRWSGIYGKETLMGVASGLNYLHSRKPPVVHRDVKSPNILVLGGLAKIADVGIARTMGASDMTAQKGYSMAWAAPEVVYRRRATEKIDIWSLGVIMWEVVTGNLPKPGRLDMPASTPADLATLYLMCVRDDPSRRPSALEVTVELRNIC